VAISMIRVRIVGHRITGVMQSKSRHDKIAVEASADGLGVQSQSVTCIPSEAQELVALVTALTPLLFAQDGLSV